MSPRPRDPRSGPWTPFPVQDWNAYARTAGWRLARVRSRVLTAVVAGAILVATGALVAIDLPAVLAARDAPFAPSDGEHQLGELVVDAGAPQPVVISSAVLPAPVSSQQTPFELGTALLAAVDGRLDTRVWRRVIDDGEQLRYQLFAVDDDIRLLARSHPEPVGFVGGLLLVPDGVVAGDRWASEGSLAGATERWRADLSAAPASEPGCLDISGAVLIGSASQRIAQTWCPDSGLVADRWAGPDGESLTRVVDGPLPAPPDTAAVTTSAPADVAGWSERTIGITELLPTGRVSRMSGVLTDVPRPTRGGDLVVGSGTDLVVLAGVSGGADEVRVRSRIHPGGPILGWQVFGDLVVTATADRRLSGFDTATGARRWVRTLPDTAHPAMARLDDTTAVVGLVTGQVMTVALADGTTLGEVAGRPGQQRPFAVDGGTVVVTMTEDTIATFVGPTLTEQWQQSTPDVTDAVLLAGDTVWARTAIGAQAYDRADGTHLSHRSQSSTGPAVATPAGLATENAGRLSLVDRDGRAVWEIAADCEDLQLADPSTIGCLGAAGLIWVGVDGGVRAGHPVPEHQLNAAGWSVDAGGVWLRPSGLWELRRWSP